MCVPSLVYELHSFSSIHSLAAQCDSLVVACGSTQIKRSFQVTVSNGLSQSRLSMLPPDPISQFSYDWHVSTACKTNHSRTPAPKITPACSRHIDLAFVLRLHHKINELLLTCGHPAPTNLTKRSCRCNKQIMSSTCHHQCTYQTMFIIKAISVASHT